MKEKYYALVLIFFTSLLALILLTNLAGAGSGIVMYSESDANNFSKYRLWNSTDFSAERDAPVLNGGNEIQWVLARGSTTRNQTAVAVMDDDGDLNLNIYNTTNNSWGEWLDTADVGRTNDAYRSFGLRSEIISGNFVIVYEDSSSNNRLISYRIWNGTDWSTNQSIALNSDVASEPQLIARVDSKTNSNELMMASVGDSDDISAARWDGDSWENITTITLTSAAVNEEKFSIEYESLSGDAMIAWGNATSAAYRIFDNTTKNWTVEQEIRNLTAVVQQVTLCSDPNSDYIGAILGPDSLNDVQAVMWNGTAWLSGEPYEEIAAENVGTVNSYCAWTNESTALFVYIDNGGLAIRYFIYNRTDETWRCSENNQLVTNLSAAEGSGGPCSTPNLMADDIETLRLEKDPNSNNITIWGLDVDLTLEMFTFNGTHIIQSSSFSNEERYYSWISTVEPAYFTYLKNPGSTIGQGIVLYGEYNDTTYLKYRIIDNGVYQQEQISPSLGFGKAFNWFLLRSSSKRNQTAVAVLDDDGDLNLNIYNISSDTFENWTDIADYGTTNDAYRGFGMRTEQLSGDFVIVYENNILNMAADRSIFYVTWNGTNWSTNQTISLNSDVTAEQQLVIRVDSKPNSDELMMASVGDSDDISTARWDGDSWENITTITLTSAAVNEEKFSIEYESLSGDAMIAWGNATSAAYRIFDNTTKNWTVEQEIRNLTAVVQQVTLCSDPNSDYIGAILGPDSLNDVQVVMWNGTAWLSGEPYEEIAAENVAVVNSYCTWRNDSIALFTYVDDGGLAIRYFIYNKTDETWRCSENDQLVTNLSAAEGSGGPCTTGNIMSDDIEVLRSEKDPNSNDIMLWGNDLAEDFEMFIFNGTHITQPTTALLETVTPTASAIEPGYFNYFKYFEEATSCTCAGLDTNWEIDMSDYCNITTTCNLGTGNITFIGAGETRFDALISMRNLEYPTTNQILFVKSQAVIEVG
ncbi:MAG: hypothetical protein ACP5NZ_04950 [Nanobdellota archaeon]